MKMNADDIKKHPKLHQYVSVKIPKVRQMPFITNALKKFSGNSSEATIKEALHITQQDRRIESQKIESIENLVQSWMRDVESLGSQQYTRRLRERTCFNLRRVTRVIT